MTQSASSGDCGQPPRDRKILVECNEDVEKELVKALQKHTFISSWLERAEQACPQVTATHGGHEIEDYDLISDPVPFAEDMIAAWAAAENAEKQIADTTTQAVAAVSRALIAGAVSVSPTVPSPPSTPEVRPATPNLLRASSSCSSSVIYEHTPFSFHVRTHDIFYGCPMRRKIYEFSVYTEHIKTCRRCDLNTEVEVGHVA